MRERFAEGEALLRGRKVSPVFCPYAPGHKAGKLVCGDARVLVNEPLGLVEPQPVMLYQLLRSLTQSDFTARSVRRERGFDIETFHKLQAAQVIAERIGNAVPRADVRAYAFRQKGKDAPGCAPALQGSAARSRRS